MRGAWRRGAEEHQNHRARNVRLDRVSDAELLACPSRGTVMPCRPKTYWTKPLQSKPARAGPRRCGRARPGKTARCCLSAYPSARPKDPPRPVADGVLPRGAGNGCGTAPDDAQPASSTRAAIANAPRPVRRKGRFILWLISAQCGRPLPARPERRRYIAVTVYVNIYLAAVGRLTERPCSGQNLNGRSRRACRKKTPMEQTLLLNATYEPLKIVHWQKAVTLWCRVRSRSSRIHDREVRAVSFSFRLPSVIRLLRRTNQATFDYVPFSRANIYARDDYTCQYCGHVFPTGTSRSTTSCRSRSVAEGLGQLCHVLRDVQSAEGRRTTRRGRHVPRSAAAPTQRRSGHPIQSDSAQAPESWRDTSTGTSSSTTPSGPVPSPRYACSYARRRVTSLSP